MRSRVTRPEPEHERTRTVDRLAAALAVRTGALEREEALGVADFALAAAHLAGLWLGAGLGAGAGAGFAGHRGRDADLRRLAGVGLLQRDFHVVAQIGAALAAGAAAAAAAAHAEQVVENIGERGGEFGAEAGRRPAAHAVLERGMAIAIIGGALVRVLQDLVGFVDFLEAVLGVLVARIAIRMAHHRLLAESGLDVTVACGALD